MMKDDIMKRNSKYDESGVREDYRRLTAYLIAKNLTISTMESATSGQIASLITDTEGASAIFPGGYITYSNQEKIRLGVPAEVIERFSVYSKEVAEEMAKVCRTAFATDITIGVTGTMGNVDPANPENSVPGRVYFAIGLMDEVYSFSVEIPHQPSRLMYKLAVAEEVYDKLKDFFLTMELAPEKREKKTNWLVEGLD